MSLVDASSRSSSPAWGLGNPGEKLRPFSSLISSALPHFLFLPVALIPGSKPAREPSRRIRLKLPPTPPAPCHVLLIHGPSAPYSRRAGTRSSSLFLFQPHFRQRSRARDRPADRATPRLHSSVFFSLYSRARNCLSTIAPRLQPPAAQSRTPRTKKRVLGIPTIPRGICASITGNKKGVWSVCCVPSARGEGKNPLPAPPDHVARRCPADSCDLRLPRPACGPSYLSLARVLHGQGRA
jgi:hypothetical protein